MPHYIWRGRTYNMSGRRGDTDSPHRGGQAVAMVAKIPPSTYPKPSPITPGGARVSRVGFGVTPKQAFPALGQIERHRRMH